MGRFLVIRSHSFLVIDKLRAKAASQYILCFVVPYTICEPPDGSFLYGPLRLVSR